MPQETIPYQPIIAITMGDPCGVGPEVIAKAFASSAGAWLAGGCMPLVVGDVLPMQRAIDLLGVNLHLKQLGVTADLNRPSDPGVIPLLSRGELTSGDIVFGRPTPAACRTAVDSIQTAVGLALSGDADAVCTCPVNKARLHENGFAFPGHTEFIKDLTGAAEVIMMLAGPKLLISLATIHEPVSKIPGLITPERLHTAIKITAEAMVRDFGINLPRIGVAGLNPHAGEAGRFGREEIEIIEPVIREAACDPRFRISGPWPPDTLFHRAFHGEFDAVVAMYHDQGLIPVKLAHFNEAVNVSLGLPIVRTSVDHGTAYDIAGTGTAHPGSLVAAVNLAALIAKNRRLAE